MNEKVLKDLYNRAVSKGYGKSQDEFVSLIQSNQKVLEDNYRYVQTKGYGKSQDDFASLVGFNPDPQKKNQIPIGIAEKSKPWDGQSTSGSQENDFNFNQSFRPEDFGISLEQDQADVTSVSDKNIKPNVIGSSIVFDNLEQVSDYTKKSTSKVLESDSFQKQVAIQGKLTDLKTEIERLPKSYDNEKAYLEAERKINEFNGLVQEYNDLSGEVELLSKEIDKEAEPFLKEMSGALSIIYPNEQFLSYDVNGKSLSQKEVEANAYENGLSVEQYIKDKNAVLRPTKNFGKRVSDETKKILKQTEDYNQYINKPLEVTGVSVPDILLAESNKIASNILRLPINMMTYLTGDNNNEILNYLNDSVSISEKVTLDSKLKHLTKEQINKGTVELALSGDVSGAAKNLALDVVGQAPNIAIAAYSPNLYVNNLGRLSTGTAVEASKNAIRKVVGPSRLYKSRPLSEGLNLGIVQMSQSKSEESYNRAIKDGMTPAQALALSVFEGGTTLLMESMFTKDLQALRGTQLGRELSKEISRGKKGAIKNILKESPKEIVEGGGEESFEEFGEWALDGVANYLATGKPLNPYEGADAMITALFSGGGSSSIGQSKKLISVIRSDAKALRLQREISDIENFIRDENLSDSQIYSLEQEQNRLYNELKKHTSNLFTEFENLDEEKKESYKKISQDIALSLDEISQMSDGDAKEALKERTKRLIDERGDILKEAKLTEAFSDTEQGVESEQEKAATAYEVSENKDGVKTVKVKENTITPSALPNVGEDITLVHLTSNDNAKNIGENGFSEEGLDKTDQENEASTVSGIYFSSDPSWNMSGEVRMPSFPKKVVAKIKNDGIISFKDDYTHDKWIEKNLLGGKNIYSVSKKEITKKLRDFGVKAILRNYGGEMSEFIVIDPSIISDYSVLENKPMSNEGYENLTKFEFEQYEGTQEDYIKNVNQFIENNPPKKTTVKSTEDAIQERETTEVPSESETQPVQEVEGEVQGEQEGEAGTQERGVETENQKEVVLKYEPKETPKQFSDLEGGTRVFKEAAGVYNKALDRRQGEQVALEDAVSYIQGTKAYENANDTQREQVVRAFRKEVGEKEKSAPSVSKLQGKQKPPTKKYTNTQITRLAEKIDARGIREGKRLGRIKEAEFTEAVKEILSDIPKGQMSASQAAILSKRAKSVRTPYQLKNFLQYADRVMNDAEYATDIKKAESLLSKIKTLSKQKNKPSNITSFAKEFSSIDPNKVPDIKQYLTYAERVLNLDRKPKVTKDGFEEPSMYVSIDEIRSEYLNKYKEMSENDLKESILSDYQDLVDQKGVNILDKSMSVEELNSIIDSIYSEEEFSLNDDQKRNTLKKLVDYKIIEVSDMSTENLSVKAKEQIEFIKKADLDGLNLSDKQLASLYASLENYIYNGSLNNIASVTSMIYAAEAHKELNDYFKKTGNSPRKWVSKWKNLALGSLAMTQVLEAIRGATKSGSLVYEKSGLYDMSANKTKAENRVSEKTSEYTKLFVDRSNKKIVEAVTNMGDRADRMIYGFLSQVPQSDFKDAIDYVEQSVDYQINDTNSNVSELAKEAKKVFDKKYKNANSIAEIDISKENLRIIDWFRDVFKEIQPEYFENAEIVHNRTLELTDNYLPFVSRVKDEISKTEDTLEQPSSLLDKVILPNRSGATNKRRNVFNSNTRYMPLDFEANMFSQYTNQVMDIETAFTIKKIASFLRSPNSVEVFGDRSMQKAFFERAKEYVNQSYESNNMGANENAVFKVFNYASNISGRVALGGVDQSLKQFVPVVLNASINAGPKNMMLGMKALVDGSAKDLISNTPVSRRAYTDQDTKRIYSKIPEAERKLFINKLKNIVRVTDRTAEQIMMYVIQNSDKVGAQASFLAYYKDFLGEDFKGFEQEGKKPNKEALAFADLMVNNTQNVNDIDQQARWLRVKNKDFTSLNRKVLFPFISFRINQIGDQIIQVSKAKNKKERVDAAKRLGGRIAEQLVFEAIRKGIYAVYGAAAGGILYALTGIEGNEDDKKDEQFLSEKNMYSVGTATLLNQLPFYGLAGPTDNIMNESVNKYYFYHVLDPKEREKYTGYISPRLDEMRVRKKLRRGYEKYKRNSKQPLFVERPDPTGIDLGALSIGAENHFSGAQAMWDIYHPIISGNDFVYTSKSGNETKLDLSDEEKKALAIFAIMENTDLFLPNDISKIATKAKRKLFTKKFREIYGDEKSGGINRAGKEINRKSNEITRD